MPLRIKSTLSFPTATQTAWDEAGTMTAQTCMSSTTGRLNSHASAEVSPDCAVQKVSQKQFESVHSTLTESLKVTLQSCRHPGIIDPDDECSHLPRSESRPPF